MIWLQQTRSLLHPSMDLYTRFAKRNKVRQPCKVTSHGEHVGDNVLTQYRGNMVKGKVEAVYGTDNGDRRWIVRFADGYTKRYNKQSLLKILIYKETAKIGKQLDYALISNRWKSCVKNCRPRWGPAMHRDRHGHKNDHALVECTWRWRLKSHKKIWTKDFNPLYVKRPTSTATLPTTRSSQRLEWRLKKSC